MKALRRALLKHYKVILLFLIGVFFGIFYRSFRFSPEHIFVSTVELIIFVGLVVVANLLWRESTILKREKASFLKQQALFEAKEKHFQKLQDQNLSFSWEIDTSYVFRFVSKNMENILGYTLDETISNLSYLDLTEDINLLQALSFFEQVQHANTQLKSTFTHIKQDGSSIWATMSVSTMLDKDGKHIGYRGLTSDINKEYEVDFALRQNEQRYSTIIDVSNTGAWEFDITTFNAWFSPSYYSMVGYQPNDPRFSDGNVQTSWIDLIHPDDLDRAQQTINNFIASNSFATYENRFRFKRADGTYAWIESRGRRLKNPDGSLASYMVGTHIDVSYYKETEKTILELSYHDQLTGCYNRRYFDEQLKNLDIENFYPLSILIADVDGLKFINDVFGHSIGDQLIIKASTIISRHLSAHHTLARVGGDEFIALMPSTDSKSVEAIIQQIEASIKMENLFGLPISLSMGYQDKKDSSQQTQLMMQQADDNMYKSKMLSHKNNRFALVQMCRKLLMIHDPSQSEQSRWVSYISKLIARKLNYTHKEMRSLLMSAYYHNIGKITSHINKLESNVPYSQVSSIILWSLNDFSSNAQDVLAQHEHVDGTGVPNKLSGNQIPFNAKIIKVALDYYLATIPYDQATHLQKSDIAKSMLEQAGKKYDQRIVTILNELVHEIVI